ncbi:hypothetical protein K439DRAFT_1373501, partial [Ramaria rubella]
ITQLRTGHVGLNVFLKKIKAVDSALCSTCHLPETVAHYLLHCCRYGTHRRRLRCSTGKASHSLQHLLSDPKIIVHTLRYIEDTNRFERYNDVAKNN